MRVLLWGVLLVGLTGCELVTAPEKDWPTHVQPMTAPASYATYWQEMQGCSGLTGDFARVSWYVGDLSDQKPFGAYGVADWKGHRIFMDSGSVADAGTVRHEILHLLLQTDGHPDEYFLARCGALLAK